MYLKIQSVCLTLSRIISLLALSNANISEQCPSNGKLHMSEHCGSTTFPTKRGEDQCFETRAHCDCFSKMVQSLEAKALRARNRA